MIITKIEEYTKGKSKIYLNDEFAFVLYKGEKRHLKLEVGDELSEAVYNEIMGKILDKRAKLRAMHLLEKQDRTEADIRKKLMEGLYPDEIIDRAVDYVKSFHYVDDARYAENYISYRLGTMSRGELKQKLAFKGIDSEIIDNKLDELYSDNKDVEYELIESLMRKKCKDLSSLDYAGKNKLFAYFYRKGFSVRDVERVFNELC